MNKAFVYDNQGFVKEIENSTEAIATTVANANMFDNLTITDNFDNLILTTIGSFLDKVPNQEWLVNELLPILIPKQQKQN